jgi:hypothetical protein
MKRTYCEENGHTFQARYDTIYKPVNKDKDNQLTWTTNTIYIHDICVRCGLTVERPKK